MQAAERFSRKIGTMPACRAFGVPRSSVYRRRAARRGRPTPTPRARQPRALTQDEREAVLDVLHTDRFVDLAPAQIWARLLEENRYLCSVRTMYRILAAHAELRERRNQLRHPAYARPELLATRPNEVWSWDITKLKGPVKWTYFYLYVLLDIYSRYVVGWMVADREAASLAKRLIEESCENQHIEPGQLTIHADRGPSMTSKPVALGGVSFSV